MDEQEDEYDIGTIQLALRHRARAEGPALLRRFILCVHSMVVINDTEHRCIKCGLTEEMD